MEHAGRIISIAERRAPDNPSGVAPLAGPRQVSRRGCFVRPTGEPRQRITKWCSEKWFQRRLSSLARCFTAPDPQQEECRQQWSPQKEQPRQRSIQKDCRKSQDHDPPIASRAARLGIIMVAPFKVTRCLLLNSLSVRVTVSRVEPTHSAICS